MNARDRPWWWRLCDLCIAPREPGPVDLGDPGVYHPSPAFATAFRASVVDGEARIRFDSLLPGRAIDVAHLQFASFQPLDEPHSPGRVVHPQADDETIETSRRLLCSFFHVPRYRDITCARLLAEDALTFVADAEVRAVKVEMLRHLKAAIDDHARRRHLEGLLTAFLHATGVESRPVQDPARCRARLDRLCSQLRALRERWDGLDLRAAEEGARRVDAVIEAAEYGARLNALPPGRWSEIALPGGMSETYRANAARWRAATAGGHPPLLFPDDWGGGTGWATPLPHCLFTRTGPSPPS